MEVEKASKDFKGKKVVFNKDGEAIPVVPIKADKLPRFTVPVSLNVKNQSEEKVSNT